MRLHKESEDQHTMLDGVAGKVGTPGNCEDFGSGVLELVRATAKARR
jgi:hypothetical protein